MGRDESVQSELVNGPCAFVPVGEKNQHHLNFFSSAIWPA